MSDNVDNPSNFPTIPIIIGVIIVILVGFFAWKYISLPKDPVFDIETVSTTCNNDFTADQSISVHIICIKDCFKHARNTINSLFANTSCPRRLFVSLVHVDHKPFLTTEQKGLVAPLEQISYHHIPTHKYKGRMPELYQSIQTRWKHTDYVAIVAPGTIATPKWDQRIINILQHAPTPQSVISQATSKDILHLPSFHSFHPKYGIPILKEHNVHMANSKTPITTIFPTMDLFACARDTYNVSTPLEPWFYHAEEYETSAMALQLYKTQTPIILTREPIMTRLALDDTLTCVKDMRKASKSMTHSHFQTIRTIQTIWNIPTNPIARTSETHFVIPKFQIFQHFDIDAFAAMAQFSTTDQSFYEDARYGILATDVPITKQWKYGSRNATIVFDT